MRGEHWVSLDRAAGDDTVRVTFRPAVGAVYRYEVESTDDAMTAVANALQSHGFRVARYVE